MNIQNFESFLVELGDKAVEHKFENCRHDTDYKAEYRLRICFNKGVAFKARIERI